MTGIINHCKQFQTFIPSGELQAGYLIVLAFDSDHQIYSGFKVLMLFECLNWQFMSDKKGKVTLEQALQAQRGRTGMAPLFNFGTSCRWVVSTTQPLYPWKIHSYY
jgi:hypothetical protein